MKPTRSLARVLVVDDDEIARTILIEQLIKLGARPVAADSAEEGLLLWQVGGFAAVITDCSMTPIDGFALTSEIRVREVAGRRQACHIWGYTASLTDAVIEQCMTSGMQGCIEKPATPSDLRGVLGASDAAHTHALGPDELDGRELFRQWIAGLVKNISIADDNYAAKDTAALLGRLHKIKSAAQVVGNDVIAKMCKNAEELCIQQRDIGLLLEAIRREVHSLVQR